MVKTRGRYTIRKVSSRTFRNSDSRFVFYSAQRISLIYGNKYLNWGNFPIKSFLDLPSGHMWMVYRDRVPVGFMMATLNGSFFDPSVKILKQQLLYASPGTRAAYYLLKEFIDFGQRNANHVISSIGSETNIKPSSLERLGFTKLEEQYRLEF